MADDSYHLYKADVKLLKILARRSTGCRSRGRAYPRTARATLTGWELYYYKRVLDELRNSGIDPYVTLFHGDLPASLPHG